MRSIPILLVLILTTGTLLEAQSSLDARITVNQEGLYELTWSELSRLTDGRPLDTESLILTSDGVEVPISFRSVTGTRFDRPSALQFYAPAQSSPYTKRRVFRLRSRPGRARIRERAVGETSLTVGEALVRQHFEEDLVFDPMETIQERWLDLDAQERTSWFWARIPPSSKENKEEESKSLLIRLEPPPRPIDKSLARVRVNVRGSMGPGVEQTIEVTLAGQKLGERSWKNEARVTVEFEIPVEELRSENILTIRNVSKDRSWSDPGNQVKKQRQNDVFVDSVDIEFKNLLLAPTGREPQLRYDLSTPRAKGAVLLDFTKSGIETFRLYDIKRHSWLRGNQIDLAAGQDHRIIACKSDGFLKPLDVSPWSARDLRDETAGADWIAITLSRFAEFVEPLAEWRQENGLKSLIVTDEEIYDAFNGGNFSPEAITTFLDHASKNWKTKPRYVLLVGDTDFDVDWISERATLPTRLVPTYYNGLSASDRALMPDQDMAVGRLPARRADEVIRMVARTIEYEKKAEDGAWRRRLNFIASEGRFGPLIDPMIERYAAKVLTEVIPASYNVTMTYASPGSAYLYPPSEFNDQVIRRFNEGALVFAYMGHGYALGFDQLRVADKRFPIFSHQDLVDIDSGLRSPLAIIIACSTAHFDQPEQDAVTEGLMRQAGGPLAVVGGTRVTHPFSNSLLAKELLSRIFGDEKPRIGDALAAAQNALANNWKADPVATLASPLVGSLDVQRLMEDHRHLYVLFGDPAAQLAMPKENISLEVQAKVQSPGNLKIVGSCSDPEIRALTLTLELRRDRLMKHTQKVDARDPKNAAVIKSNYELANEKKLVEIQIAVSNGKFDVTMELPEGLPAGPAVLKAFHDGDATSSIGSALVLIENDQKKSEAVVEEETSEEN